MTKFNIPVKGGQRIEFATLADLGKHYATLAIAYRRKGDDVSISRADAYDIVSWQLQNSNEA